MTLTMTGIVCTLFGLVCVDAAGRETAKVLGLGKHDVKKGSAKETRLFFAFLGAMFLIGFWCIAYGLAAEKQETAQSRPLIRAHAHNDYLHKRPLLDSLNHGFCSVEADVFLIDGALLVGHERTELKGNRTLEALYLDPLLRRVRENGGRVYPGVPGFILLVDIKSDGLKTYVQLHKVLAGYAEMLTSVEDGIIEKKAVTVIISGNRAWDRISADPTRYAGVDGRLSDLSSNRPSHLMPLISDHWGQNFTWHGQGPMPEVERAKLRRIVRNAHEKGRRVRFWATPDRPSPERTAVWIELLAAGVDHIGTDDLAGLATFLLSVEDEDHSLASGL